MTGGRGSILVVDDEAESLRLMICILEEQGYRVRACDSGRLALTSIAAEPPELILLDLRMPGMDGLEVCRRLKESEGSREIPLIFISASADPEEHVQGFALGAVDFVSKPFRREEMLARVRTHLELGRLRSHLEMQVAQRTTELRAALEQLRESEERFRNLADRAPVMIWVAGPDKLFTFVNKTWLDFTGHTMDQELGNGWAARVHPEDRDRCHESYCLSFDARRNFQIECRLRRADGEYRWVLATGTPRFEPGGAFAGYIGSCTDIDDVKCTQEAVLARQKLESLGVLAGGIAHDFNNLLGAILTTSELVLLELPGSSPAREGVESIKNVTDRAAEIVRQMMAYAGQERTVFESVNLSGLVNGMLQLLKVSISKRARLTVDLPENPPAVRANAAQIRQVVMNLIINASEALGGKEGVISVTLAHVRPGPYPFAASTPNLLQNDHLRLAVSDTGCGMTEEIQARVFDPFFTTKFTGRGLGLSAVQGIIRDHGGAISVVSAPGKGSRFEVRLPCISQPAPDIRDIEAPASAGKVGSVGRSELPEIDSPHQESCALDGRDCLLHGSLTG